MNRKVNLRRPGLIYAAQKLWAYAGFSAPLMAPNWYAATNLEGFTALFAAWFGTMGMLWLLLMIDSPERHKDLRRLLMRRRHFDAMFNGNKDRATDE